MGSLDISHPLLILIGAFYTFAGLVGIRMAVQGRVFDVAIAAISMKPVPWAEMARGLWLLVFSVPVLAGGLLLILRLEWAAWAFVISAVAQALYLLLVAPLFFDPHDPPDAQGRRQTVNAFVLYAAATAFVLWAYGTGRLMTPDRVGWPLVFGALTLSGGALLYGLWRYWYPFARPAEALGLGSRASGGDEIEGAEEDAAAPARPPHDSRRIVVMADYGCDPLWTHESEPSGMIPPGDLPLSEALIADLVAWARSYDGSFNFEDFDKPNWSEAQYEAHRLEGIALARRLKGELPDRQIFFWHHETGHTEITSAGDET